MTTQTSGVSHLTEKLYTVSDIALMLKISNRKAYDLCHNTKDFKIVRLGRCVRVHKESFDEWFSHL